MMNAVEWYRVSGRLAASFAAKSLPDDVWEPGEFLHTVVDIDGRNYLVTGVEKFAIHIPPKGFGSLKHGYNHVFGLLVEEVEE